MYCVMRASAPSVYRYSFLYISLVLSFDSIYTTHAKELVLIQKA